VNGELTKADGGKLGVAVRSALFLVAIALGLSTALGAATITGRITDVAGNPIAGAQVRFQLSNYGSGNPPRCLPGGCLYLNLQPIAATTDATGHFSQTLTENSLIAPAGTLYSVMIYANTLPGSNYSNGLYSIPAGTWDLSTLTPQAAIPAVPPATAYQTILNSGSALAQRLAMNFSGSGVSCADNPGSLRTDCTISGSGGGAGNWSNEEGPAGQIDGVNVSFSVAHAPSPATSLRLVLNGLTLHSGAGNDFTLSGNTITFAYAPTAGSNLICWYEW
jgi:hypothetical protein